MGVCSQGTTAYSVVTVLYSSLIEQEPLLNLNSFPGEGVVENFKDARHFGYFSNQTWGDCAIQDCKYWSMGCSAAD